MGVQQHSQAFAELTRNTELWRMLSYPSTEAFTRKSFAFKNGYQRVQTGGHPTDHADTSTLELDVWC